MATYHYSVIELCIDGIDAYDVVRDEAVVMSWDFLSQHIFYWSQIIQKVKNGDFVNSCIKRTVVDEGLLVSIQRDIASATGDDRVDIIFSHNMKDLKPKSKAFKGVSLRLLEKAISEGCHEYCNVVRSHYIKLGAIAESDTPEWNRRWESYFRV